MFQLVTRGRILTTILLGSLINNNTSQSVKKM